MVRIYLKLGKDNDEYVDVVNSFRDVLNAYSAGGVHRLSTAGGKYVGIDFRNVWKVKEL